MSSFAKAFLRTHADLDKLKVHTMKTHERATTKGFIILLCIVRPGRISEFYRLVIDWTSRSQSTDVGHTLYTVQMTGVRVKTATEKLEWTRL